MSDFPFGATKERVHSDKWDESTVTVKHTLVPPGSPQNSTNPEIFDTRHDGIVLAIGRYCLVPNMHPYTVTDGAKITQEYPNVKSIRCHYFINEAPLPNLQSLELNFCVDDKYTLVCDSLSSAVYQCGKR